MPANHRVQFLSLVILAFMAQVAGAQATATTRVRADAAVLATVTGAVHDSLAKRPLASAEVQLVAADSGRFGKTVVSDAQGEFSFSDVPDGRYMLGFYHPMLDSLGLEPIAREVFVVGQRNMRADLAIPPPARLRAAICGPATPANSGGVVVGIVRQAKDRKPAVGVTVAAEWIEYSIARGGVSRRTPRRVATSQASGWFAICNVPSPGSMMMTASRGTDSTDVIEVDVTADGFLRRELYVGAARTVVIPDTGRTAAAKRDSAQRTSAQREGAAATESRRMHVGDGRLSGVVFAADGGQTIAGAQVAIANGPQARTNERGEWAINDAPAGTRVLEVRSVGYYPTRQIVDVIEGAPPLRLELLTLKAVLSTVKVTASYDRFRRLEEFKERNRTGVGRYMSAEDIEKRRLIVASDLFRNFSGVYLDGNSAIDTVKMRGITDERCVPTFFLNGNRLDALTVSDIDVMVRPAEIAGVEVYMPGTVPLQFQVAMSGCGSILIWTK